MRGVFVGVLGLTFLSLVVAQPTNANAARLGSLGSWTAGAVKRFLSPDVPAIPDRNASKVVAQQSQAAFVAGTTGVYPSPASVPRPSP